MGSQVLGVTCVVRRDSFLGCLLHSLLLLNLLLGRLVLSRSVLLLHIESANETGVNGLAHELDLVLLDVDTWGRRLLLEEGVTLGI